MPAIYLKAGREKSVLHRHPWIFLSAIDHLVSDVVTGETVDVLDSRGQFLARGALNPHSQICIRIWSWNPDEMIDPDFFRSRLEQAFSYRDNVIDLSRTNAYRLFHAESDGLPGLVIDRYDKALVVQFLTAGIQLWRETVLDLLWSVGDKYTIFERSDADVRALEGLKPVVGTVRGVDPPLRLTIQENNLIFGVDVRNGHKTGFYLDQRINREKIRNYVPGRKVLDCFTYSGGFAISALSGGAASVTGVDSSGAALAIALENLTANGFQKDRMEWIEGDVFKMLRGFRDRGFTYDMIILDPPKFAPTSAQAQRAARGYKDINLLAFKLLSPGGLLVTFSCSGGVSEDLFLKIVAGAALDAGRSTRVVERLHQAPDHPVSLNFPEGAYLKGFIIEAH